MDGSAPKWWSPDYLPNDIDEAVELLQRAKRALEEEE